MPFLGTLTTLKLNIAELAIIKSPTHRLFEADAMPPEHANTAQTEFYTVGELARMLSTANDTLRPLVAIGALAGLRTAELLRLDCFGP
jgi:hypothetical protein